MSYRHTNQFATKISDLIWIGNYLDGQNPSRLEKTGATAILDLANNIPSRPTDCEIYVRCPFPDSDKANPFVIASAVLHLRAMVGLGHRTLVHCKGGHSRSVIIYALHETLYGGLEPKWPRYEPPVKVLGRHIERVRSLREIGDENPKVGLRVQAEGALKLIIDREL